MKKTAVIKISVLQIVFVLLCAFSVFSQTQELSANKQPFGKEISAKEKHIYNINLNQGEFGQIVVVQKGVDLIVKLFDSNGNALVERDTPNGTFGAERISFISNSKTYKIEVSPLSENILSGKYEISFSVKTKANENDLLRIETEKVYQDGVNLSNQTQADAKKQARAKLEEAIKGWQKLDDKYLESLTLESLAFLIFNPEDADKTLEYINRSLSLAKEINDKSREISALKSLGDVNYSLKKFEQAVDFYNKSAVLAKSIGETETEILVLQSIVATYYGNEEWEKSAESYRKLLEIYQRTNNGKAEAETLNSIGVAKSSGGNYQEAFEFYKRSAELAAKLKLPEIESQAFHNLGIDYDNLGKWQESLAAYKRAAEIRKASGDFAKAAESLEKTADIYFQQKNYKEQINTNLKLSDIYQKTKNAEAEAKTLNLIGIAFINLKEEKKAADYYLKSLEIYRKLKDQSGESLTLNNLGLNYFGLMEYQKAIEYFRQAADIRKQIGESEKAAKSLQSLATTYDNFGESNKAIAVFQEQIEIYRQLKDLKGEARVLNYIGVIYSNKFNDLQKSKEFTEKAIELARSSNDKKFEAKLLYNLGSSLSILGNTREAINVLEKSLEISRGLNDKSEEADTLEKIAAVYSTSYNSIENYEKAIGYIQKALEIYRLAKDLESEASALNTLGVLYGNLKNYDESKASYVRALEIAEKTGSKKIKADTFHNLSIFYDRTGDIPKGLEYERQALVLFQETKDKLGESAALDGLGRSYVNLGSYEQALKYFTQGLELSKKTGERNRTALFLGRIAGAYISSNRYQTSIDFSKQSLSLFREMEDKKGELTVLINIGIAYGNLQNQEKALEYFEAGLKLSRELGNLNSEATALQGLALIHYLNNDYEKSFELLQQALPLFRIAKERENEAGSLTNLMILSKNQNKNRLAIFYGKQAINLFQQLRSELKTIDKDLQTSFLKSKEEKYRQLADLLIEEGRLAEAEQVLAMLKEEEFSSFVQRDSAEVDKLSKRADLTKNEKDALERYTNISANIAKIGEEFGELRNRRTSGVELTEVEKERYKELSKQLNDANQSFQVFLRELAEEFAGNKKAVQEVAENSSLQADLKEWGNGVVYLHTLVGEDKYRVILTTPNVQTDGKSEIKSADLNKKIQMFREQVQNPKLDPRPLGKELYDIIVKPIEKQLADSKAKTLLWSLDGSLRLLPLAALWDGEQYFGQKYANVIVTLASRTRLGDAVKADWRVLGLGVSQAKNLKAPGETRDMEFSALPAVKQELASIIQNENSKDSAKGVLPGKAFLDEEFTESKFIDQLLNGYKVIHIASHFSLNPGDSTKSFLLLGDGKVLTVNEIKNNAEIDFSGVELLTLSACQTAVVEKDDTGKEVEGFGYIAQQKGAKAILATLWSVSDESTSLLMSEFYRIKKENPNLTKAEAMQNAQAKMINGQLKPSDEKKIERSGTFSVTDSPKNTLKYEYDAKKPFAHPYFWSPFVLIGNWR